MRSGQKKRANYGTNWKPLFDKYIKDANARGLPGEEAVEFCFDYLKNHQ